MKRDALCPIDHCGREIVIDKPYDPLRKLPAERYHPILQCGLNFLPLVVQMTAQVVYPIVIPTATNRVCKFAVDYISGAVGELAVK